MQQTFQLVPASQYESLECRHGSALEPVIAVEVIDRIVASTEIGPLLGNGLARHVCHCRDEERMLDHYVHCRGSVLDLLDTCEHCKYLQSEVRCDVGVRTYCPYRHIDLGAGSVIVSGHGKAND